MSFGVQTARTDFSRRLPFLTLGVVCLTPLLSPPFALALGLLFALAWGNPYPEESKRAAKTLLQACVALLGFGMNLPVVWQAGLSGAALAAATIALTLALGWLSGKWLRVHRVTSLLISAGTAICGGSAIAAVGSVMGAAESEITVAMGTVFLLNAVALCLFPLLGHALHLSQATFGTWAGIAIHDISSVVGASSQYGMGALQTATAVKLSRSLWIIPVTLVAGIITGEARAAENGAAKRWTPPVPVFLILFLLASLLRSYVSFVAGVAPILTHLATVGLTLTLYLIGAGLSRKALRAVGWQPLAQGLFLWFAISAFSLWMALHRF